LRNFEIPPKIEISIFFQKKNPLCKGCTKTCSHYLGF
jgi:hypothetical protein